MGCLMVGWQATARFGWFLPYLHGEALESALKTRILWEAWANVPLQCLATMRTCRTRNYINMCVSTLYRQQPTAKGRPPPLLHAWLVHTLTW